MLDRGVPMKDVSNNLGHCSIATTSIYDDVIKGKIRKAISPMSLIQGDEDAK